MIPVSPYGVVPLDGKSNGVAEKIDGEEYVSSPVDPSAIFYGSENTFIKLSSVLTDLAQRALVGSFKDCSVAIPVRYPDGKVALLSARFTLGEPFTLGKPIEMGIR